MNQKSKYRVLNRDIIKYFAMAAMLLNHIANVFLTMGSPLYEALVDIGYFTAITMCYFLVEGYQYTHSKMSYGARLFLFAVISQIPFAMAFRDHFGVGLNMIFTLFVCFLILVVREKVQNPVLRVLLVVFLVFVTMFSDWQLFAALFTVMFDAWRGDRKKIWLAYVIAAVSFGAMQLIGYSQFFSVQKAAVCTAGAVCGILVSGIVIQCFYNGERAKYGRKISKWFFYLFYPLHLTVLALLNMYWL